MRKFIKVILHFVALIIYRVKKVGEENVPKEGAFVLCGNHVHALDAPAIVLTAKRKVIFLAKAELFKNPILKWLADVFDIIPVNRGKQDLESMKRSLKAISKGEILGIFPEGTRKGLEKNVKVKTGAAFMALRAGVPIIPVGIQGDFKPFKKVIINYGKPMDFSYYYSNKPEKEVLEKVTEEVMAEIIKLTNQKV
ncbi:MAG: 1-acyl-sn-glycerol-3-phosphate acyltransferase [Clostridia bacterium]|nr:1-acyl-sn-glycerol-3-phosphate acyltransferase [Clostridia bacterium]